MNIDLNFNLNDDNSVLKVFDPRARILCAFLLSICISLVPVCPVLMRESAAHCDDINLIFNLQLFLIALIPVILFILNAKNLIHIMLHVNSAGLIMLVFMLISFEDYKYGLYMGLNMLLKLNFICLIFLNFVAAMGIKKIDAALYYLGINEKLRLLLILTVRGIFILIERTVCAVRAANLRVLNMKNLNLKLKLKLFACLLGSSLIQSMKRSDKISIAVKCRGGFNGFNQAEILKWRLCDSVLFLGCVLYVIIIFMI